MKMTISERIKQCYEHSEARSVRSYAINLGLPESTLRDIINKGAEPRASFISAFLHKNPRISADWLLTGQGSMLNDEKLSSVDVTAQNSIVGNQNTGNTLAPADDSFWKSLINELRSTITDLRARCSTYEQQNQELQRLLDEERQRNFYQPMIIDNK